MILDTHKAQLTALCNITELEPAFRIVRLYQDRKHYLSLGGSLLDLDETCFWSRPIAGCDTSAPFLRSDCTLEEEISCDEAVAVLKGVCDLDRS